ncbi:MAG TPA: hypothetical protein VMF13_15790, partial [Luteitalea sp.]|nr:hypothetical protein [Luteitalea sp.]
MLHSFVLALSLSTQLPVAPPPQAVVTADPDVAATVNRLLGTAQHPGLRWGSLSDVSRELWVAYER